jgi:hypothetical protein
MQDRSPPARQNHLQRTAGPYIWVIASAVCVPVTSGLPRSTDTMRPPWHVSNAPAAVGTDRVETAGTAESTPPERSLISLRYLGRILSIAFAERVHIPSDDWPVPSSRTRMARRELA